MTFDEIDSGKEKRRKRLSNKRYEKTSSGRKHAKRRRFIRQEFYKDVSYDGVDVPVDVNENGEGEDEKEFREGQEREAEEQEKDDREW